MSKGNKCYFHTTSFTYLAYVISQEDVATDSVGKEWPVFCSIKNLLMFIRFTNSYRQFSSITATLNVLMKGAHRSFTKLHPEVFFSHNFSPVEWSGLEGVVK